ncbi:hypothetical protein V5799_031349 [Amblyomma americanum]|uniref:Uncharacterized protein n=1 Tax=Amblyomma americanum TaxID=6943 RepID=A0AAQ4EKI8_AMBAM
MRAHRGTLRTLSSVCSLRAVVPAAGTAIHGIVYTPVGLLNEQHLEYASVNNSATCPSARSSLTCEHNLCARGARSRPAPAQARTRSTSQSGLITKA